jgi:hypothetical protein
MRYLMENAVPLGRPDNVELGHLLSHYDAPAFVRRDRRVREAFDRLLDRCRRQRDEWLEMVRIRIGALYALAGDWGSLALLLADEEQIHVLRQLHVTLEPELRVPEEPTSSIRILRRALRELVESLERFNRRWRQFLQEVDLMEVNDLREGYNRYYLLEKECALRSARLARQRFQPFESVTREELAARFPVFAIPVCK